VTEAAASLAGDIRGAGSGLVRLMRFDPNWANGFDASFAGFVRSFAGQALALPPYLMVVAILAHVDPPGAARPANYLWAATAAQVLNALAYPIVIALAARVFRFGQGFGAFIVVTNWAQLYMNLLLAGAALFALFGDVGAGVFRFAWLVLLLGSIFITWRAARETLTDEIAPIMLTVVLSVGVSAAAEGVASMLLG